MTDFRKMTQEQVNECVAICKEMYGKNATITALNKLYHEGKISIEQIHGLLDVLNDYR